MKKINVILILLAFVAAQSCTTCQNSENPENSLLQGESDIEQEIIKSQEMAKVILVAIPSPVELADLLRRAGAKYDVAVLNSVENKDNYNTEKSLALNLGVYSADLSFSSMFDQPQQSIKYLAASKSLAEELGIIEAITRSTIQRMEDNLENKDSLMDIISETFMNSNAYLHENERPETAGVILVGGWLEGLYIATKISQNADEGKEELVGRITDQRYSLENLLKLLDEYKDNPDIEPLIADLKIIDAVFKKMSVKEGKSSVTKDPTTGKNIISSDTKVSISPETFEELCLKVAEFRNRVTSGGLI